MKNRISVRILLAVLMIIILMVAFVPGEAFGWSAVVLNKTHGSIDVEAYNILSNDPAFGNVPFPSLISITENDYVWPDRTGTGPDVPGQSFASSHYYNPRIPDGMYKGGGPEELSEQFGMLLSCLQTGQTSGIAQAASWAAHYAADLNTPYHTQGMSREDVEYLYAEALNRGESTVPLPPYVTGPMGLNMWGISWNPITHPDDFRDEIKAFLDGTFEHISTEDWFDPWYWDGTAGAMATSSHVLYEAETFVMPGSLLDVSGEAVTTYASWWQNPQPSITNYLGNQTAQVIKFGQDTAGITAAMVDAERGEVSATTYLAAAIQSVATVWRASFTALSPELTITIPDQNEPQKLKVQAIITNAAVESVENVNLHLQVIGGSIKSGDATPLLGSIGASGQRMYTWEVQASQLGYCTTKLQVIGSYFETPDLQYAETEATLPGIIPVTSSVTGANRDHSIVFCLDNSYSMYGQPIADAMNAGVQAVNAAPYAGTEMALYFFGTNDCDPPVRIVDFTTNRDTIKAAIRTASARGDTPLAAMIATAGDYIRSSAEGEAATIILLTDGMETCSGDPLEAARNLNPNLNLHSSLFVKTAYAASDIPIKLQIVGFNIPYSDDQMYLQQIARAGNGSYYAAANLDELTDALTQAMEDATGKSFEFQAWWAYVGIVLAILIIALLIVRGRRKQVPAEITAGYQTAVQIQPGYDGRTVSAGTASRYCPDCGKQVSAKAAYCTSCGASLPPLQATQPVTYCTSCGTRNENAAYCRECGASLLVKSRQQPQLQAHSRADTGAAAVSQPPANQARTEKISAGWWLLAIFTGIIGGTIGWAVHKQENPKTAGRLLMLGLTITALVFLTIVSNMI